VPNIALTDLTLRSLKSDQRTDFWDTKTPGFGVRVGSRSKTFIVKSGNSRVSLGSYPECSLQEARRRALAAKSEVRSSGPTIAVPKALDLFLAQDRWRPQSKYQINRTLRKYFHWQKNVDKVTHNDVAQVIDAIDAKHEASHALKDIKAFFNWCVPRYIPHSPCVGIKPPARYIPRQRVLSDDEMRRVWNAAKQMGYPFGHIAQMLLMTGTRKSEMANVKWLDISGDILTIHETKNGRPLTIPLSPLAVSILSTIPPLVGEEYVFVGRVRGQPYNGWNKNLLELRALSNTTKWSCHDLRRTMAHNWQRLGIRIEVTEAALNHVSGSRGGIVGVYQTYNYEKEVREAVVLWEERLKVIVGCEAA
jgi:integrase